MRSILLLLLLCGLVFGQVNQIPTASGGGGGSVSNDATLGGGSPSTSTAPSQSAAQVYIAANSSSLLTGSGAPNDAAGSNGNMYLDTTATCLYGPKASGAWPGSCTSLIGSSWFGGSITPIVTGNWTSFGSGCSTTNTTTVGGGAAIQVVTSSGTQNICGVKVTASGTFSHVFAFYAALSALQFSTIEVGFTDGTKAEYCGASTGSNGSINALAGSQAKASLLTGGSLSAANGPSSYSIPYPNGAGPVFFRLGATAGTSLKCDFSPDGVNWINLFTDTTPFLTPSSLYFGGDPRGATAISMGILASYN